MKPHEKMSLLKQLTIIRFVFVLGTVICPLARLSILGRVFDYFRWKDFCNLL